MAPTTARTAPAAAQQTQQFKQARKTNSQLNFSPLRPCVQSREVFWSGGSGRCGVRCGPVRSGGVWLGVWSGVRLGSRWGVGARLKPQENGRPKLHGGPFCRSSGPREVCCLWKRLTSLQGRWYPCQRTWTLRTKILKFIGFEGRACKLRNLDTSGRDKRKPEYWASTDKKTVTSLVTCMKGLVHLVPPVAATLAQQRKLKPLREKCPQFVFCHCQNLTVLRRARLKLVHPSRLIHTQKSPVMGALRAISHERNDEQTDYTFERKQISSYDMRKKQQTHENTRNM